MSQESGKLYVFLVILSIAIVVMAAGLYTLAASSMGAKPFTFPAQKEDRTLSVSGSASTFVVPDKASICAHTAWRVAGNAIGAGYIHYRGMMT